MSLKDALSLRDFLRQEAVDKQKREHEALKKAVAELQGMPDRGDQEECHSRADDILCEYLIAIGAKELSDTFKFTRSRIGFWYA